MNNLDNLIQQTPLVQPAPENQTLNNEPIKNRKSSFLIIFGVVIIIAVIGMGRYLLGVRNNSLPYQSQVQTKTTTPTIAEALPTSTPTSSLESMPQENILYFGTVDGVDALFFTNKQQQEYFDPGAIKKTSPYVGALKRIDGVGNSLFDYKKLTNPRRITLSINSPLFSVESLKFNNSNTMLYISLNLEAKTSAQYPDNLVNKVYQIKLNILSGNEIWANDVGSDKYTGKGVAYLNQISEDKFLAMLIGDCYACGGHTPTKTVILNITTRSEKYKEGIGEIQFNLQSNTFTYKKLAPFKEPCGPSPDCDSDGTRTVMKPSGQVYTEVLP